MPERASYPPGTPSWVDLASPDLDASALFYGGLFGWEAVETGPLEETGGYRMFMHDGRHVAGLGPLQSDEGPPFWTTYVSVQDADAAVRRISEAGGRTLMEPLDVLRAGRMAVLADPAGAAFAVWQPAEHEGAAVVDEPGAPAWNELVTRDVDGSRRFYREAFGWVGEPQPLAHTTYTVWTLRGERVGGMLEMDDQWPAEVPPFWMVYFAVKDADAAAELTEDLGGRVSVAPMDLPVGRFAMLHGPHGEVFSVIALAAPGSDEKSTGASPASYSG